MRRVILESPYAGNVQANIDYARRCVRDSVLRGEAPIASHLLFTQPGILDDLNPEEREFGINAGLAWLTYADAMVLYIDRGMSPGMQEAMRRSSTRQRAYRGALNRCGRGRCSMKDLETFITLGQAMQRSIDRILAQPRAIDAVLVTELNMPDVRSEFTGLVVSTLERKRRIDRDNAGANNMAGYDRWLVDAVELLLQIELERRGNPK